MIIYPASKARHWLFWQALRAAGLPIVSPCWIDCEFNATGEEPSYDGWARHWEECCTLAASADICLFLALPGEQHCGALLEAGAALGAGKRVYAVSAVAFSFLAHPRTRRFATLASAVNAIRARVAGEEARLLAMLTGEHGKAA
jgi:hypothetical protein